MDKGIFGNKKLFERLDKIAEKINQVISKLEDLRVAMEYQANETEEDYQSEIEYIEETHDTKPKNHALIIGINEYDINAYGIGITSLRGCVTDAKNNEKLWKEDMDSTTILLDEQATKERFRKEFIKLLKKTKKGDRAFLISSRHGTRIKDESGDEESGYDAAMCMYDGLILDDEIDALIRKYGNEGAELIIDSDACENGTISKALLSADLNTRVKAVVLPRSMFDEARRESKEIITKASSLPLRMLVFTISGADDNNYSYDLGEEGGLYTITKMDAWKRYGKNITIEELYGQLVQNMQAQHPFVDRTTNGFDKIFKTPYIKK